MRGWTKRRTAFALLALAGALAGCAAPGAPGTMSADCATMKRQQQAMVARGQQNTDAYRQLLDKYLSRCFH